MKRWPAIAAGLIVLGVALRLYGLTRHSLWYDEAATIVNSAYASFGELWRELIAKRGGSERFQPLNIVLLWGWRQCAGSSDWALRLFPALLGILSLPVFYATARVLWKNERTACWCLAFFSTSAYAVYYAQEIRPYALLMLLTTLLIGAFVRTSRAPSFANALALAVASLLAFLGSIFSAFFIAGLALADAYRTRRWHPLSRRWLPTVVLCLPVAAFYLFSQGAGGDNTGAGVPTLQQSVWQNVAFVLYGVGVGTTFGPSVEEIRSGAVSAIKSAWLPLSMLVLCAAAWGSAVVWRARSRPRTREQVRGHLPALLMAAAGMFAIQVTIAVFMDFNWQPRHAYWLLPVLALVLGGLAVQNRWTMGCALLWMALNLYSLSNYWHDPRHAKDDVRGMAAFLHQQQPGPLANGSSPVLLHLYRHYGLEDLCQIDPSAAPLNEQLKKLDGDAPIWFVHYRPFYSAWPTRNHLIAALEPEYEITEEHAFKNIALLRLREIPQSPAAPLQGK